MPTLVFAPPPQLPERARRAGVNGTVVVRARVGTDGHVHEARVARSIPLLDAAALECVSRWRYRPALWNGVPVDTWVRIPVRFGHETLAATPPKRGAHKAGGHAARASGHRKRDEDTNSEPSTTATAARTHAPAPELLPPPTEPRAGRGEPLMKPLRVQLPRGAPDPGRDAIVIVEALVDADGKVRDARVVSSVPPLDEAAVDAVKQATFPPPSGAAPAARWVSVPVKFRR